MAILAFGGGCMEKPPDPDETALLISATSVSVLEATENLVAARRAYRAETKLTKRPHPRNRDYWDRLRDYLLSLREWSDRMLKLLGEPDERPPG